MYGRKTKKDMYKENPCMQKTIINRETAIKPYYFYRNGMLHVRYTVDRCMELSSLESTRLKIELTEKPYDKQNVLAKAWNFYSNTVEKPVLMDGVAELERRMKKYAEGENGQQNKGSDFQ